MECIRGLGELTDTVVVDNASTDGTQDLLSGQYRELITYFYPLRRNVGFGKAHNFVFNQSYIGAYDYVFLLNQDAAISRPDFEALLHKAETRTEYGLLSPVHYRSEGKLDAAFGRYLRNANPVTNGVREVPFVNAAIWLLRRSVIDAIGFFNPVFPHYGEDENFATRMRIAGYRLGIVTDVTGYHYRNMVAVSQRLDMSPYAFWIVGLLRVVDPGRGVGKAVLVTVWDYLKLVVRLVTMGKVRRVSAHLRFLLRFLTCLPRYVRYHQLVIRDTGITAADEP